MSTPLTRRGVWRTLLALALGLMLGIASFGLASATEPNCGTTVQYRGVEYDTVANTSKFTYTVNAPSTDSVEWWVISVDDCITQDDVVATSDSWVWLDSGGPLNSGKAIKFTASVGAGQSHDFWFKLNHLHDSKMQIVSLNWYGSDCYSTGPACSPPPDVPEAPWALLFPLTGATVVAGFLMWRRQYAMRPA